MCTFEFSITFFKTDTGYPVTPIKRTFPSFFSSSSAGKVSFIIVDMVSGNSQSWTYEIINIYLYEVIK